ncbi:hypothetical protein ABBQ32_002900 [Trebouxia sp. C0010 RCD-2024]
MLNVKPHHVSLCVLLRAFLDSDALEDVVSDEGFQSLGDFLLLEIRARKTVKYPSLTGLLLQLQQALSSKDTGDQIASLLMEQLGGLQYPDDLVTFFSDMSQLMHNHASSLDVDSMKGGADISSAMGFYIRHCCVSFHMLAFEAACGLFNDLQAYKEAAIHEQQGFQAPQGLSKPALRNQAALHALLNQEMARQETLSGVLPAADLVAAADELAELAPEVAKVDLLKHSHALHQEDYLAAVDTLYKYFDSSTGTQTPRPIASTMGVEPNKGHLQEALLSLGAAQTHFGHVQEALLALNEAVRIAQQHNDNVALAHALGALCHILSTAAPAAVTHLTEAGTAAANPAGHLPQLLKILKRCEKRAQDLQLPHLFVFARLALAQFALEHQTGSDHNSKNKSTPQLSGAAQGRSSAALGVSQAVQDTARLQQAAKLAAAVALPPAPAAPAPGMAGNVGPRASVADLFTATPPVFAANAPVGCGPASADAVEKLAGSAHLLQAASWKLAGNRSLTQASALTHLACYSESASSEDRALAYAQLAHVAMSKKGYRAAAEVLAVADAQLPHSNSPALQAARLGLAHGRALHRGNARHAALFASQLLGLADPTDSVCKTLRIEAQQAQVRTLLVTGRYEEAAESARELFERCTEAGMQVQAVELLLLLGQIHQAAGAPLTALPYILSCLLHSTDLHMDLLAADASCSLAAIWLGLGPSHGQQAAQQLRSVLPTVLGNGDTDLQARAQMLLAQAMLAEASQAELRANPDGVLQPLQTAAAGFAALEDYSKAAEAQHLIAVVCHSVNNTSMRNAAAGEFHKLTWQARQAQAC